MWNPSGETASKFIKGSSDHSVTCNGGSFTVGVVETSSNTTIKPVNYLEIVLRVANGL